MTEVTQEEIKALRREISQIQVEVMRLNAVIEGIVNGANMGKNFIAPPCGLCGNGNPLAMQPGTCPQKDCPHGMN